MGHINKNISFFVVFLVFLLTSCTGEYAGDFSGTVIDAETGKPIEGAFVIVQWTEIKGWPGLSHHKHYKTVDVETGKGGKFLVSGVKKLNIDDPKIIIFKEGYVAWRNDFIFPNWEMRKDFKYGKGVIVNLEHYKKEYSRSEHHSFMVHGITGY